MAPLPSRRPSGETNYTPDRPLLASEDALSEQTSSPRLAHEETPRASGRTPSVPPPLPTFSPAPEARQSHSESVDAQPVAEAVQSPSVASTAPATGISTAPTIENLSEMQATELADQIDAQKAREYAINKLPEKLKQSIYRLFEHITDDTSSEVTINGPQSIGFKRSGQRYFDPEIDLGDTQTYHAIINSFLLPLTNTNDRLEETPYLIEGQLVIHDNDGNNRPPLVARVHIIAPPAVENAKITIAKKARSTFTIDSMVATGSLTSDMAKFLKSLARGRATIVFSGLSGSGKTTLLEAMSHEFDTSDRIVLVEDTEELTLPVSDLVALRSHQARPGEDLTKAVSLEWLVRQANRMRPDRIIVGEVRGAEMAEFLTAANSGADGSMTTVHASSPQQAINKMVSLSLKSDSVKSESSLLRDIASTVQIIVQMSLIDGRHVVSQIEEVSSVVNKATMGIQTSTIFKFDRNTTRFTFENRVSDELTMFLRQRGVEVQNPTTFIPPNSRY